MQRRDANAAVLEARRLLRATWVSWGWEIVVFGGAIGRTGRNGGEKERSERSVKSGREKCEFDAIKKIYRCHY